MTPAGATNQHIGLLWAWLPLLQQSPLNGPAEQANTSYQHVIILFTDGLNTGDRWYGDYSGQSSYVDSAMSTLCTNIKSTGVIIYTVQIDADGAGQSAVLPACASLRDATRLRCDRIEGIAKRNTRFLSLRLQTVTNRV